MDGENTSVNLQLLLLDISFHGNVTHIIGFRPHAKLGYTDAMRNKGRFKVLTGDDEDLILLGCCAMSIDIYRHFEGTTISRNFGNFISPHGV